MGSSRRHRLDPPLVRRSWCLLVVGAWCVWFLVVMAAGCGVLLRILLICWYSLPVFSACDASLVVVLLVVLLVLLLLWLWLLLLLAHRRPPN